ncbi:hypothetical protein [Demequina sp.]|uniref:hypothetical protein n=1 Tax=Demequina sp. TaxID=2050685 RepID=UPI0025C679A2|nr:hypothetical protein [Demequina sp.]
MGIDLVGHNVPASTDAPARSAFNKLSLTIRDPLPVADAAARTTLLASLAAATPAVVPSASSPIFFYQADLPAAHRVIWTVDGDNFISTSGHYVWADDADRTAATGMTSGDLGFQVDTDVEYLYSGTTWLRYTTGWLSDFTNGSGWTPATSGQWQSLKYRVTKGLVTVNGVSTKSSWAALNLIATMPDDVRPDGQVEASGVARMHPDGQLLAAASGTTALGIHLVYPIKTT